MPTAENATTEIGLVSCTKTKRDRPAVAAELYEPSTLFSKARRYCERHHDEWYVLSAKHHLLAPDDGPIEPYDETLVGAPKARRREWASVVADELEEGGLLRSDTVLVIHAGRDYYEELVPLLEAFDGEVRLPLEGLGIGERLQWYDDRA